MNDKFLVIFLMFLALAGKNANGQSCGTLGQNPGTAFPVCGTATFSQSTVPICGGTKVACPCHDIDYTDKNPFWYKFTCFTSGTFGFAITPNTASEDYDWQLFDVTGHSINEVYSNPSLFVACNWSSNPGPTGTWVGGNTGNSLINCQGPSYPNLSQMPVIIQGHNYVLLVSHFSDSQSGYSLSFDGGTASITDTIVPHLSKARAICNGTSMTVKLNKKMKCSSVEADGGDFVFSSPVSTIIHETGINCNNGFDTDSLLLTLNNPVPPGNYKIYIKNGNTDGNTLLDNCDRQITVGDSIDVVVYPLIPTPMDSIAPVSCAPDMIELVFRDQIQCSSIQPTGSDFILTSLSGGTPVTITGAAGVCSNTGLTSVIQIQLSAPIKLAGRYSIQLQTGTDGNTIINECGVETPAGAIVFFNTGDTVSAAFNYQVKLACKADTIHFSHPGYNHVNSWFWSFDNNITSTSEDTTLIYNDFGPKQAILFVSNGFCSAADTISNIILGNTLRASFEPTMIVCPNEPAKFVDHSIGILKSWFWDFGNGTFSNSPTPSLQYYPNTHTNIQIPTQLIVTDSLGCRDTAIVIIETVANCYIAVPSAFSPNNDGVNDYLYPYNAYKAKDLHFTVYNRFGQKLFETTNWLNKWDGTYKGSPQDIGTYVWVLDYTDYDTSKFVHLQGYTVLIR